MRKRVSILVALLAISGLAFSQGAGGGTKETIAQKLRKDANAGPGYIQDDFLKGLGTGLQERFGEKRGDEMMENLRDQGLSEKDVLGLLNGNTTRSGMTDTFGAKRSELKGLEQVIDKSVSGKNEKMFFGIMVVVMVGDFDLDPKSDFCQQASGARKEMDPEMFKKLMSKNVSTKTIGEAFGFDNKSDQKFMQDILNQMMQSMFTRHPMAASMGMSGGKSLSKGDKDKFPKMSKGMPGFPGAGSGFENGKAGGLPFDIKMPPCPFAGDNMAGFFGGKGGKSGKNSGGKSGESDSEEG